MQSFQYSPKSNDINSFIELILKDDTQYKMLTKKLKKNPDWISDNFTNDLSEVKLFNLINGIKNKKNKTNLLFFIEYANGDAISNRNFQMLFEPELKIFEESLVVILSHKKLQEKQLLYLCDFETSFECFFELAILYYTEKQYDVSIFKAFLDRFMTSKFSYLNSELIYELQETESSIPEKSIVLQQQLMDSSKPLKKSD